MLPKDVLLKIIGLAHLSWVDDWKIQKRKIPNLIFLCEDSNINVSSYIISAWKHEYDKHPFRPSSRFSRELIKLTKDVRWINECIPEYNKTCYKVYLDRYPFHN